MRPRRKPPPKTELDRLESFSKTRAREDAGFLLPKAGGARYDQPVTLSLPCLSTIFPSFCK